MDTLVRASAAGFFYTARAGGTSIPSAAATTISKRPEDCTGGGGAAPWEEDGGEAEWFFAAVYISRLVLPSAAFGLHIEHASVIDSSRPPHSTRSTIGALRSSAAHLRPRPSRSDLVPPTALAESAAMPFTAALGGAKRLREGGLSSSLPSPLLFSLSPSSYTSSSSASPRARTASSTSSSSIAPELLLVHPQPVSPLLASAPQPRPRVIDVDAEDDVKPAGIL
ncbi:hypothetical protein C8R45DRAFT_1209279 [Mycena sanguinolenta]|nr:hypothetical protein C8R45DRAFT_1209279 [Mycena sanguinolenta]